MIGLVFSPTLFLLLEDVVYFLPSSGFGLPQSRPQPAVAT
jgi:hypothetical protein